MNQLSHQWTLFEKYANQGKSNYKQSIKNIVAFQTVEDLLFILNKTIYSKVTDIFTNILDCNRLRVFEQFQETLAKQVVIDAIMLFRDGIKPEWEDIRNKMGGELQFEIKSSYYNQLDGFYQDIILEIIGGSNQVSGFVNGIRIMDKFRGIPSHIRFDLWLPFNPKSQEHSSVTTQLVQMVDDIIQDHNLQVELKIISHQ